MSDVASLELCQELHKLSGWDEEWLSHSNTTPKYDLGYLLRKLPPSTEIKRMGKARADIVRLGEYVAWNDNHKGRYHADTPEDATAKLAIELFKQGILPTNKEKEE